MKQGDEHEENTDCNTMHGHGQRSLRAKSRDPQEDRTLRCVFFDGLADIRLEEQTGLIRPGDGGGLYTLARLRYDVLARHARADAKNTRRASRDRYTLGTVLPTRLSVLAGIVQ